MGRTVAAGDAHTRATFQAFVDSVIPPTVQCNGEFIPKYIPGGVDLNVHDFLIWELDHSVAILSAANPASMTFSQSTALLLNIGADHLIRTEQALYPPIPYIPPGSGTFPALSHIDRLRTIELLNRLEIPEQLLPIPYSNNPELIQVMMNVIHQITLFGFYSEWSGYGSTKFLQPDFRRLEHIPLSWILVGYPGPSFGYRDFRGFLLRYPGRRTNV